MLSRGLFATKRWTKERLAWPRFLLWTACIVAVFVCEAFPESGVIAGKDDRLSKEEAERLFARQVWPRMRAKCLPCHGGEGKIKGNLDLRELSGALKGGDSGEALVPGDAEKSLLIAAIGWENEDLRMPPKENDRLSAGEVAEFKAWIQAGAPWPSDERIQELAQSAPDAASADGSVQVSTSGGLSEEWTRRRYRPENLWVYQPLAKPALPAGGHPIDAFIDSGLKERGLQTAPKADRLTLLRRATYDLLGLPPVPEEAASFLADPRSDGEAFAAVMERLLASPHYGERWGRHWLDVVRYADTAGLANDFDRGNAWRYRDYVIRSFNDDKPYRQFIREQIAGDELNSVDPEHWIAAGFLRMGPWELTGMEVPAIARQRFLDDAVNIVGDRKSVV